MKTGWKTATLGELCRISSTLVDPRRSDFCQLLHVGAGNIESGTGRLLELRTAADERLVSGKFLFDERMVLYSKIRPYLAKVARPEFSGLCSADIYPLLPVDGQIDRGFLYYMLLSERFTAFALGGSARAGMPKVNREHLFAYSQGVPPLPEQRRIVGILDDAFEAIATAKTNAEQNLQNARSILDNYLESVFAERHEGWVTKRLSELCDIKHGFAFDGQCFSKSGEYVLLTPGNFYEAGGYRDRGDKQKFYTGEIPPGYVLREGDLLVAMTEQAAGLLGSPVLVPASDRFLHNQRLGLVTGKPGVPWSNEFFFHVFNLAAVRRALHRSSSGVKVRHTSPSKIGEVVVSVPTSLAEQEKIVSKLRGLVGETRRLAEIYEAKARALDALEKSFLHQAFSGNL